MIAATVHNRPMHSMTGFGRGSATTTAWTASVEISTVNRKQAEVVIQAPRELAGLDARIRKVVLSAISRGRAQLSITLERAEGSHESIRVDTGLAKAFHDAFNDLGRTIGHPLLPTTSDYLRQPGILTIGTGDINEDEAWLAIEPALTEALDSLMAMRHTEGTHLKEDFHLRLETLRNYKKAIEERAPERPIRQRDLLLKRLREVGLEIDLSDERVLKELALFADRCDITEEITRLDSHFSKFNEYLAADGPQGRALDFLCQEIFREFNTIGSKANDAPIAQVVVEAKTELEKIREQVQNAE